MHDALSLALLVTIQLLALAALGAGPGLAVWRAARLPAAFLPVCVLASALLIAYSVLFLWLTSHAAAIVVVRAAGAASVVGAAWLVARTNDRRPLLDAAMIFVAMAAAAWALLLVLGAVPVDASARFGVALPNDNVLPRYLADRFYDPAVTLRSVGGSLEGIYLTSDRPPLQSTALMALWTLVPSYRLTTYQVFGTLCQIGWMPALCALSTALGLDRRTRSFVLAAVACSGFTLLNTLYPWPKLLSGWLFLGALAMWLLRDPAAVERRSVRAALGGALLALSALSHGGVAFSLLLLPALPWLVARSGHGETRRNWRATAGGVLVFFAVLAPWMAYQRFVDPPGNRLVKWHLAGVEKVDPRGVGQALVDQYGSTPIGTLASARWVNLREQWLTFEAAPRSDWRTWLQWQQFFHLIPALDTLAIGLLALLAVPGAHRLRALVWYALLTWVLWILLMFMPSSALVHQGSYGNVLLLCTLGAIGLSRVPRAIGATCIAAHAAFFAYVWLGVSTTTVTPRHAWLYAGAALYLATLVWLSRLPTAPRSAPESAS